MTPSTIVRRIVPPSFTMQCPMFNAQCSRATGQGSLLRKLNFVRHPVFPRTPSRRHAVWRALEDGLDFMEQSLLHLEELGDLPRPRLDRACRQLAAGGRLEVTRRTGVVI